jgi:tetratricopeptide (TPR) repeat protein
MSEELDDAAARYALILSADPVNREALHRLALVRLRQGRPQEAEPLLLKALELDPGWAEAYNSLGAAERALRRHEAAIASYRRALAARPGYAEAHNNLGNAYFELARYEAAMGEYDRALAIRPAYADALANRATTLKTLGRLDEARQGFEQAIALAPTAARLYFELADCKRFTPDDPHLAAMQDLMQDEASLLDESRMLLHFALAKALADFGEHARAFAHLNIANRLKRQETAYDEAAVLGELKRIRAIFTPALMQALRDAGNASPVPIFIVGMPRSGSTLVEQILASHPAIAAAGEINDFPALVAGLGGAARFPEAVSTLTAARLHRLGSDYLARVGAMAPAAARITDKLLANFRHVGLIHLALPRARIIHTRRDPLDTCLSCYSKLFTDDQPFAYDLGELGRYYRAYAELMDHWHRLLPGETLLDVRYEAVVDDIEGEARRIIAHCGLPWDERCLDFHRTARPVRTASANQVRQPIYRTSVERSRAYAALLQPLRDALGALA